MKRSLQAKEAFLNLMHAKLRTFLALLGILVGTASVVAMVSGGRLATNAALQQIQALGTDLLGVSIRPPQQTGAKSASVKSELSLDEALGMKDAHASITALAPYTQSYTNIDFNGHKIDAPIMGTTEELKPIVHVEMASGRFVSFLDKTALQCVVGEEVGGQIERVSGRTPIGQQLKLGDKFCNIVGYMATWPENGFVFVNLNKAVIIPIDASLTLNNYTKINNLVLQLDKDHPPVDEIQEALSKYIDEKQPGANLYFRSPQQLLDSMKKQSDILTMFLGFVGGVSLLVGGIGVMNIMLVSVMERRREIGIRLAVGAKRRDIQMLFLIESIVLSVVGGALGVIVGVLISFIVAKARGWLFAFFITPPIIGFSVSVLIGVFFGFYPAYKASKLNPIQALRMD